MKACMLVLSLALMVPSAASASGFDETVTATRGVWDSANHPKILVPNYEAAFDALPLAGQVAKEPWSDTYWPRQKGGVAYRWQTKVTPYSYKILNRRKVVAMKPAEIAKLSPAEKLDIMNGNYSFPLTKEVKKQNDPDAEDWEGICHGWSPAAIHLPAGKPVTLKNRDGIEVAFGASDFNALTSFYYAKRPVGSTSFMGRRCRDVAGSVACADVNAGAFHVVLGNLVGLQSRSFVVDVTPSGQVWNQPVHSYSSAVMRERAPSPEAAPGTVREIQVDTAFVYTKELKPNWNPQTPYLARLTYSYWLELDGAGKIVGGSWISNARPDFAWSKPKATLKNEFAFINGAI